MLLLALGKRLRQTGEGHSNRERVWDAGFLVLVLAR
jgi:hypothetical protein